MYAPPPTGIPEPFVLLTSSPQSLGYSGAATLQGACTSATWSAINLAVFFPFVLTSSRTYTGMIWMNGAAVSGNVNGAVYSADGVTALATIGTVAQAGTTAQQKKAFGTALTLPPGKYFMALAIDNTTATIVGQATDIRTLRMSGARELASFFALTATAAAWVGYATAARSWMFGLYEPSWL